MSSWPNQPNPLPKPGQPSPPPVVSAAEPVKTPVGWLASKSASSHTVAAVLVTVAAIITSDAQVQQLIGSLFAHYPAIAADIICLAGILAKYSHSTKQGGN